MESSSSLAAKVMLHIVTVSKPIYICIQHMYAVQVGLDAITQGIIGRAHAGCWHGCCIKDEEALLGSAV